MRMRRWALGLLLVGIIILAAGWIWHRHGSQQTDPRLVTIQLVLNSQYRQEPWFSVITGLELRGNDLYVRTSLPAPAPNQQPPPEVRQTTRPIYNVLWDYVAFQHPETHVSRVVILNRYGTYLDGGQY